MTVRSATVLNVGLRDDASAILATWAGIGDADTCSPLALYPEYATKSVHVSGTFGGATIVLNGSNTGTNFFGLKDLQGNAISKTQEGLSAVQETVAQYQPATSSGSGSSVTVTMLFVKSSSQPRG